MEFRVYDENGRVIINNRREDESESGHYEFDLTNQTSEIYYVISRLGQKLRKKFRLL